MASQSKVVKHIGVELGINPGTLDTIKITSMHDTGECFTRLLEEWLMMVQPTPTLAALADALCSPSVGYNHLAEKILSLGM